MPVFQLSGGKADTLRAKLSGRVLFLRVSCLNALSKMEPCPRRIFFTVSAVLRLALRKQDLMVRASFVLKNSSVLTGNECELWCLEQHRIQIRASLGGPPAPGQCKTLLCWVFAPVSLASLCIDGCLPVAVSLSSSC